MEIIWFLASVGLAVLCNHFLPTDPYAQLDPLQGGMLFLVIVGVASAIFAVVFFVWFGRW